MLRVSTGIPALDELLQGGFPKPSAIGLIGDVGSGKSIFCTQLTYNLLQKGFMVMYYTVDQGADDVKEMMQKFGWDISEYERRNKIHFIDIFERGLQAITAKTKEGRAWEGIIQPDKVAEASFNLQTIITAGQAFALSATGKDLFVVFDSLTPLFFGYDDYRKVVRLLQHMKFGSRISGAIGISTLVRGAHPENIENACQMLADGVIELRRIERAGHIERYLRIKKMHKTTFSEDYYPMEITNSGIVVHNVPTSSFIPIP